MPSAPPPLAVLRHALADPLSAATAKAEVLAARLLREAPALAARAEDLGADLAAAGRLLELLSALSEISEESPTAVPLGRLAAPFCAGPGSSTLLLVRPVAAADAIRRVVAFGASRGGTPILGARTKDGRAELVADCLGPVTGVPPARLLLLPREVPEADDLFVAAAALASDGGELRLSAEGSALRATLSWPVGGGA